MENSSLNLAHFHSRQADNHLRYRRFDDAIENHQKAADYLEEAIKSTTTTLAIESLKLQKNYHMKQKELIKIKQLQYKKYKNVLDQQQNVIQKNIKLNDKEEKLVSKNKNETSCQLQLAIYKTMEETDSLLEILGRKGSDTDSLKSLESDIDEIQLNREDLVTQKPENLVHIKKPKDESVVIEELRSLNHQLHIMLCQLVTQLDESLQENNVLRDRVLELEKEKIEKIYQENATTSAAAAMVIKIIPKSTNTEIQTKKDDDISPDVIEAQEFPALAPLELPHFDYESFSSKNINQAFTK